MVDRKVAVVAVAVGVVLIGGIAGAMLLGGDGGDNGGTDDSDGAGGEGGGSAATPTPGATTAGNGTVNGTATNGTATPSPTVAPTSVPTSTAAPTVTETATPVGTRTPKLPRRFSEEKIERELRRMINDWREQQGLDPYTNANGTLVGRLDAMATNHSTAMADREELVHESNNLSVAERYRAFDLYETCKFKKRGAQYIVTPAKYQFEVLHRTYAGRNYEDGGETVFHENETAVARDIFEEWTQNPVYADVLDYPNANRLGVGIELTQTNEVWVTGNICGSGSE